MNKTISAVIVGSRLRFIYCLRYAYTCSTFIVFMSNVDAKGEKRFTLSKHASDEGIHKSWPFYETVNNKRELRATEIMRKPRSAYRSLL